MAKYLFCFPRFHTNAIPWIRILVDGGHDVSMFVVLRSRTESYSVINPVVIRRSKLSEWIVSRFPGRGVNCPRAFPSFFQHWKAMNTENPDVVIVRDISRWFSIMTAVVCWLQRRSLLVYNQQEVCPEPFTRGWAKRQIVRLIASVQFSSRRGLGEDLSCRGPASFIPFGLAKGGGGSGLIKRRGDHTPRILMVAKYRERKGHRILIDALAIVAEKHAFKITFCGEEATREDINFRRDVEAYAETCGISKNATFIANVDYRDMPEIYTNHDVFVLPSRNEPAAVSPIEAASFGCAVLISEDSGTRGYFPADSRYSINPESPADIAKKLIDLLSTPETLLGAREDCFKRIHEFCSDIRILREFQSY